MIDTFEELETTLGKIPWFTRLGQFSERDGFVRLSSLAAWRSQGEEANPAEERIARELDWLPSSRDQDDPFQAAASRTLTTKERQRLLKIYRQALASLRDFEGAAQLRVGPHDFTEAAKGAAVFACRAAGRELLLGEGTRWRELLEIYMQGNWPCGLLPGGKIVVL